MLSRNKKTQKNANSTIRIIGGEWRGRKLNVPQAEGLRPTGDRVKETLFNWLMPTLPGSYCLDLFAGTGALGLEALSRGAKQVQFAELNAAAANQLRANLSMLHCDRAQVYTGDSLNLLLQLPAQAFDVVFLDPPFSAALWDKALASLQSGGWLHNNSLVYIESPKQTPPSLSNWQCHREKIAGDVRYGLYHG